MGFQTIFYRGSTQAVNATAANQMAVIISLIPFELPF
jgi:hypothetical protein